MAAIWRQVFPINNRGGCDCPTCARAMTKATAELDSKARTFNFCRVCEFFWFEAGEYEALPPAPPRPRVPGDFDYSGLPMELREKRAMMKVDEITESARADDPTPDGGWKIVPSLFGLPIEMDSDGLDCVPWATYFFSLFIAGVSIAAFPHLQEIVGIYGLIPNHLWRDDGLTLLTSFFLHGSWFHLVTNLYFLLVFGRAVENNLGVWRWLLVLLVADQTGNLLHILGDPRSDVPCVGASGGISGVITYYALRFPRARLGMLLNYGYVYWRWIRFPAWVAFLLWIGLQMLYAWEQLSGFSNDSALAHFGGVGAGVVFWLIWRKRQRRSRCR